MDMEIVVGAKVLLKKHHIGCVIGHDGSSEGESQWVILIYDFCGSVWQSWCFANTEDLKVLGHFGQYSYDFEDLDHPLENPQEICTPDNCQDVGKAREWFNNHYLHRHNMLFNGEWDIEDCTQL